MKVILNSKKQSGRGNKSACLKGINYAGAVLLAAFAGQAFAGDQELDTLVAPGGYEILGDGRAVFRLADGRSIFLEQDQYLLLEGGLLMVVDELAQTAFTSLPVMGAIRTELLGGVQPVRDVDGGEILMSDAQPLWSGEGSAPTLFDQVEVVSHELAQSTGSDDDESGNGLGVSLGVSSLVLGALAVTRMVPAAPPPPPAPNGPVPTVIDGVVQVLGDTGAGSGTLETAALSSHVTWADADNDIATFAVSSTAFTPTLTPATADGMLAGTVDGVTSNGTTSWTSITSAIKVTVTDAEGNTGTQDLIAAGQLVLPDSAVADAMSVTITGAGADDYVGYNAANAASTSPLTNLGRGIGVTSTIDLGDGQNFMRLGHEAANGGVMTYTGGSGDDTLRVADKFANWNGTATLDLSAGGNNSLDTGDMPAVSGTMTYIGGAGSDTLTMGNNFGNDGDVTLDMSKGGNNQLTAMWMAAVSGNFSYTGGSGQDDLNFGMQFGSNGSVITIDMQKGGMNTMDTTDMALTASTLVYTGGGDSDTLTFGNWLGSNGGDATFDMSAGGSNVLSAQDHVADSGVFAYQGGNDDDDLDFGNYFANNSGSATIDLSSGGDNEITMGEFAGQSGTMTITGGRDGDVLTFGGYLGVNGGTMQFDMSLGSGDNSLTALNNAAQSAVLSYTGGRGADAVSMGGYSVVNGGSATIDMSAGGDNSFSAGTNSVQSGTLSYIGGSGDDSISLTGPYVASNGGSLTLDMSNGSGENSVDGGAYFAQSGTLSYVGGSGRDDLQFGSSLAIWTGQATFDMSNGGYNTLTAGTDTARTGGLSYTGGNGVDELTFGPGFVNNGGSATLDVGIDNASDVIAFQGAVADATGVCMIQNFDPLRDSIDVPHTSFSITATGASSAQVASTAGTHFAFTVTGVTATDLANAII